MKAAPLLLLVFLGLSGLSACTPAPRVEAPPVTGPPQGFPADFYEQAARAGEPVYRVDPEQSLVVGYVYSEGPLAPTLGHSHVVSTRQIHGYILPRDAGGRADFYLAVEALAVDDPELRAEAGFTSDLSEQDIEATRNNMLTKVLEAGRYPYVLLRLDDLPLQGGSAPLTGLLTLHGQTEAVEIPARVAMAADVLSTEGEFRITHTQFGMTPYSALSGALRVSDGLDFRFRIVARRIGPAPGGR